MGQGAVEVDGTEIMDAALLKHLIVGKTVALSRGRSNVKWGLG